VLDGDIDGFVREYLLQYAGQEFGERRKARNKLDPPGKD
jgi:hypothetical protein